jgi:hypothetical protein
MKLIKNDNSVNRETMTNSLEKEPDWFNNILVSGDKQVGLYLEGLKSICGKLITLCRLLSISMLGISLAYALLIWKDIPAAEPRNILVGWAICLFLSKLGIIALEGKNSTTLAPSIILIIIIYWAPVAKINSLLNSF